MHSSLNGLQGTRFSIIGNPDKYDKLFLCMQNPNGIFGNNSKISNPLMFDDEMKICGE